MRVTKSNRFLLGFALFTCVMLAGMTALYCVQQSSPINPENFAKIKNGMTEKEVVEILGPGQRGDGCLHWDGPDWVATIYFSEEGLMVAKIFGPNDHTFLKKLRRSLGL